MKPYKCPVCAGSGLVPHWFYDLSIPDFSIPDTTGGTYRVPCRACGGQGIIWGSEYMPEPDMADLNQFEKALKTNVTWGESWLSDPPTESATYSGPPLISM